MLGRGVTTLLSIVVILVVSVPLHLLARLDWPWAVLIGAAVAIVLRRLIDGRRFGEPLAPGS